VTDYAIRITLLYIQRTFPSVRFVTVVTQVRVTVATKYGALKYRMNANYVVGHERASRILFRCIMSNP
jgi:hypothetical protein